MSVNKCPQRHTTHDFSYLGPLDEAPVPLGNQKGHVLVSSKTMQCLWLDDTAIAILNIKRTPKVVFGEYIPFWDLFEADEELKHPFMKSRPSRDLRLAAKRLGDGCNRLDITIETDPDQDVFLVNLSAEIFSVTDAREFIASHPCECYLLWRLQDEKSFDSLKLADISARRVFSTIPESDIVGAEMGDLLQGNACPLASHLKEQLGFDLTSQDKSFLSLWSQTSDGNWFVDFEGVHKAVITRLPNRFILYRFYRIYRDEVQLSDILDHKELNGYWIWDLETSQDDTESAPNFRLVSTNAVGAKYLNSASPKGMLMSEIADHLQHTPLCELMKISLETGNRAELRECNLYQNAPSRLSESFNTIFHLEIRTVCRTSVLCTFKDVSEVVAARTVNRQTTVLLDAVPTPCILASGSLRVIFMNSSARSLTRFNLDDFRNLQVEGFVPGKTADLIQAMKDSKPVRPRPAVIHTTDDIHVPITLSAVPLIDTTNDKSSMIVIFLSESWENMEQSRELKEAMRRAEASAAAKSDFLATMSHEIRTPLNGIVGSAELLQSSDGLDNSQLQCISHIQNCSTTLLGIISDILDFAKIDSQKMDIEKTPFSVIDCVDACTSILSQEIRSRDQTLITSICTHCDQAARVVGDATRVRQIFLNLIGNACKFTPNGGSIEVGICICSAAGRSECLRNSILDDAWAIELDAGAARREKPKEEPIISSHQLRFFVRDTGRGMTPRQLTGLFEPFVQASTTGSAKGRGLCSSFERGSGLGLSIVKKILEAMSGACVVRSAQNAGTCFAINIPCEVVKFEPPPLANTNIAIFAQKSGLVVHGIASMLQFEGASVTELKCGTPLATIANGVFDAIIFDVPEQDIPTKSTIERLRPTLKLNGKVCLLANFRSQLMLKNEFGDTSYVSPFFIPTTFRAFSSILTKQTQSSYLHEELAKRPVMRQTLTASDSRRKLQVLVVEDNKTNRVVLVKMLQRLGVENADAVEDGVEATEAVKQKEYDVVFMDIHMPRMCGWDAARIIRDMGSRGEAKPVGWIVALTAASTLSDKEESLKLMNMFVSKPISMAKLAEILNHISECLGIVQTFQVRKQSSNTSVGASHLVGVDSTLTPTAASVPTISKDLKMGILMSGQQSQYDASLQWLGGLIFGFVLVFLLLIRA